MPANAGIHGGERRNLAIGHAGPRQGGKENAPDLTGTRQ
jgi:hypothetical protein